MSLILNENNQKKVVKFQDLPRGTIIKITSINVHHQLYDAEEHDYFVGHIILKLSNPFTLETDLFAKIRFDHEYEFCSIYAFSLTDNSHWTNRENFENDLFNWEVVPNGTAITVSNNYEG